MDVSTASSSSRLLPRLSSTSRRKSIILYVNSTKESVPRSARRFLGQLRWSALFSSLPNSATSSQVDSSSPPKSPVQEHKQRKKSKPKHIPLVVPPHGETYLYGIPLSPYSARSAQQLPRNPASRKIRHVEIKLRKDLVDRKYYPGSPQSPEQSSSGADSDSIFSQKDRASVSTTYSEAFSLECFLQGDDDSKSQETLVTSPATPIIESSLKFPTPPEMSTPSAASATRPSNPPELHRINTQDMPLEGGAQLRTPASNFQNSAVDPSPAISQPPETPQQSSSNIGLSGFVCNVHRTTGREPKPLVGATTTIVGDKLFVFGGRRISRSSPQLTSDLYELDLIRRNWSKVECRGDIPPPRYFHSVCPLGDTKLVCYGGMSQSNPANGATSTTQSADPNSQVSMDVMSDIHIYDVPSRTWRKIVSLNSPQGRYAHCATILPSSATFSSPKAPISAIQHNPSFNSPNQGKLGTTIDGSGGAEMVVVGGQDPSNHYIEQISVFNLRSLTWTSTSPLGRQCGAYRTVTAPLVASVASQIGMGNSHSHADSERGNSPPDGGSAMLIYSNYNFLDVKLELQIHLPDGTLVEKVMQGRHSPPGLRFPNGGVIDNHFVVSGTLLTSYKQEYALWALDLRTLMWSRIDIGSSTFSQGSWNRGILWQRRNAFVILGNRKRSLVEDYNHRRVNFSNMCVVELEAFGFYDNPRRVSPMSGHISASSPSLIPNTTDSLTSRQELSDRFASGREMSRAAEDLGRMALNSPELADMDFLAINGERIPVNSRVIARRWGPYFLNLLRESIIAAEGNETSTLRPSISTVTSKSSRNSSITITTNARSVGNDSQGTANTFVNSEAAESNINPANRPRTLYLPHTPLTIQALLHYLYTSSLPPPSSHLCTPQILCSILQIARPYKIDGLLEAVVERLHAVLDNRNTAAIFNAAAMAAGGGEGVEFVEDADRASLLASRRRAAQSARPESPLLGEDQSSKANGSTDAFKKAVNASADPALGTPNLNDAREPPSPSLSNTDMSESEGEGGKKVEDMWSGTLSAVVGLQKRGLRGLMEGRRIREMGSRETPGGNLAAGGERVGLGIGA
jgi:hypothetical protein